MKASLLFFTLTVVLAADSSRIAAGAEHDWNLGATGLRGWIRYDKMVTSDAREITITKVEDCSPVDGVFLVGDSILGVGGKPFSCDPRTEMGKALTLAESEAGKGNLRLTLSRAGNSKEVVVKLPVLGTYSATAPYDCPKSKRILEQGCRDLARQMADPSYAEH
jgi:hypothetical protein